MPALLWDVYCRVIDNLGDNLEGRRLDAAVYRLRRIERKLSVRTEGGASAGACDAAPRTVMALADGGPVLVGHSRACHLPASGL